MNALIQNDFEKLRHYNPDGSHWQLQVYTEECLVNNNI